MSMPGLGPISVTCQFIDSDSQDGVPYADHYLLRLTVDRSQAGPADLSITAKTNANPTGVCVDTVPAASYQSGVPFNRFVRVPSAPSTMFLIQMLSAGTVLATTMCNGVRGPSPTPMSDPPPPPSA